MYIDTHAHFDICINGGDTEDNLISAMAENHVDFAVQVGVDKENLIWTAEFAARHENIFFTLGIHPASKFDTEDFHYLEKLVLENKNPKLIGIGETGLDYHWMEHERKIQIDLFEKQIELAVKNNLSVIVHSRDAMEDTISVLKNMHPRKVILHCFSGSASDAVALTDMGFYISFAGNLTYKKAENLHEVVKKIPIEMLLFETDCPYLAPIPQRGKKNRPDFVKHTYEFAAVQRNCDVESLCEEVTRNFTRLINS